MGKIEEGKKVHGEAEPEKLTMFPDDLVGLQNDIEAYIKEFGVSCKSRLGKKLSDPGVILVLGDPQIATKIDGKTPMAGTWSVAVLNHKLPNKPNLKKLFETWVGTRQNVKLPQKPDRITMEEGTGEGFLFKDQAYFNDETSQIWFNAHVKYSKANGGDMIHEVFHMYGGGAPDTGTDHFGWLLDEGFNEWFARDFVGEKTKWQKFAAPLKAYEGPTMTAKVIAAAVGRDKLARLYFDRFAKVSGAKTDIINAAKNVVKPLKADGVGKQLVPQKDLDVFIAAVKKHY